MASKNLNTIKLSTNGKQISIEKCLQKLARKRFERYLAPQFKGMLLYPPNARQISIVDGSTSALLDVQMIEPGRKVKFTCSTNGCESTVEFEIKKVFSANGDRGLHHFYLKSGGNEAEFITNQSVLYTE